MTIPAGTYQNPIPRVGARMVLLDPQCRVLLIHERYDGDRTHWITPGGGVEPQESLIDAACREVFEETGLCLTLPSHSVAVLQTRRRWSYRDQHYDQVDHFFVATVAAPFDPFPAALTEQERDLTLGSRWWSIEELRSTDEEILPPQLADVIDQFFAC